MKVVLIAAQSLDGFITRHEEPGSSFTSAEDKAYFLNALHAFDCRVMGAASYQQTRSGTRRSSEKGRYHAILTREPERYQGETLPGQLEFTAESPSALVTSLSSRGYRHCALLGGSQIYTLFLEAGLVDELWITVEPLLFGTGTPLISRSVNLRLELFQTEALSRDTLLLRYRCLRA